MAEQPHPPLRILAHGRRNVAESDRSQSPTAFFVALRLGSLVAWVRELISRGRFRFWWFRWPVDAVRGGIRRVLQRWVHAL